MKILAGCFAVMLVTTAVSQTSTSMLNGLLDERIKINREYQKQNIEEAKTSKYAKQLVNYEQKVGESWVEFFEYAKKSDDAKLKKIALKLEYYEELRGHTYDLEYAEEAGGKKNAIAGIQTYEKKLKALE